MRILLAQNALYFPSHGGGEKSNRMLMEALAARGHDIRVASRAPALGLDAHEGLVTELRRRHVPVRADASHHGVQFVRNGVDVHILTKAASLRTVLFHHLKSFAPDVILISTDDPAQLLLEVALGAANARVVYLIRAIVATPFGPDSASPSGARTAALQRVDGAVGVSEYVAGYARVHGGLPAVHVPISLLDPGEVPRLGRFDNPFVSMVNPCGVKGISIFLALARRLPDMRFACVPSWATTEADLSALRELPNVTILAPYDNPDDLMRQTRVMLVPSLWAEARSRLILESMIRGVPVLASEVGGSREAALGAATLLPVNPLVHYRHERDKLMVPQAEIPDQDVGPWQFELERLTSDPAHYQRLSAEVFQAARAYWATLTAEPFEGYLKEVVSTPKRAAPLLSDDKQRLLALRLRQQRVKREVKGDA